jgi:hypothetical protein
MNPGFLLSPCGEQIRQSFKALVKSEDTANSRKFESVRIGATDIAVEVMMFGEDCSDHQPLLIIHSIEFPMPPSISFCEEMWEAGLRVVFVRRPGFGESSAMPNVLLSERGIGNASAVFYEAVLLSQLVLQLKLKKVVLLAIGSSNPVCYRLCKLNANIELSVFANAMFNQDIWDVFRPKWFRWMLRDLVATESGARIAAKGIKYQLKKDPLTFFEQIFQKSPGDLQYMSENASDCLEASQLIRMLDTSTFHYDLKMSLAYDKTLTNAFFSDAHTVILSGKETTDLWQSQLELEAERLGLCIEYAPSGDMFAPYASPTFLADVIGKYKIQRASNQRRQA